VQLAALSWPQAAALSKDMPVVIPVAALEQHGWHLPVFTDSMLLGEVVRRAAEKLRDQALFTPLFWLGNSAHHMDFSGTLTAGPANYIHLLNDLMECLIAHGFRRLVLVNGHGGNIVPGQQAIFEVRQKHRDRDDLLLLFATYWQLGSKPKEVEPALRQSRMGHACEWETSMMLKIAPQLVGDLSKVQPVEFDAPFEPAHRAWTTKDRSEQGHIGYPADATAEKGETLLQLFSQDMIAFLERVAAWSGKGWGESG
jgi:creatinine amidohydrolase